MMEEIKKMKKEVKDIQEKTFALELLHDFKKQNKRLFLIWIITFISFIALGIYTIWLLNDIGTETITTGTTKTIDIDDVSTIQDSHIHN